jgi:hypothetical protein
MIKMKRLNRGFFDTNILRGSSRLQLIIGCNCCCYRSGRIKLDANFPFVTPRPVDDILTIIHDILTRDPSCPLLVWCRVSCAFFVTRPLCSLSDFLQYRL